MTSDYKVDNFLNRTLTGGSFENIHGGFCKQLPALSELNLSSNKLNSLKELSKCVSLITLKLMDNSLNGNSLKNIKNMNKLREL